MHSDRPDNRPVILLTEEDTSQREDIARYLDESGFVVIEAGDSDTAMTILEVRSTVRGFVTNAHLPGRIDGFELARIVRERWPSIAVIMMSGHSDPSTGPVPEGAEFIAKPYLLEYLAPTLRRMIGPASRAIPTAS
jgi:DNA-binding NtrC family response regulator